MNQACLLLERCFIYFLSLLKNLFIYDYAGSSLLSGLFSSCSELVSHCGVLSSGSTGSRARGFTSCGMWGQQLPLCALECGLSSSGARVGLGARGTWDLPGSGIKPVSLALAGVFFTTEPPGSPGEGF